MQGREASSPSLPSECRACSHHPIYRHHILNNDTCITLHETHEVAQLKFESAEHVTCCHVITYHTMLNAKHKLHMQLTNSPIEIWFLPPRGALCCTTTSTIYFKQFLPVFFVLLCSFLLVFASVLQFFCQFLVVFCSVLLVFASVFVVFLQFFISFC